MTADDDKTAGESKPVWGSAPDDFPTLEDRRSVLRLLAGSRATLGELAESLDYDIMPYVHQAIAIELMDTSIALMEAQETIAEMRSALVFFGRFAMGFLGSNDTGFMKDLDDDEDPPADPEEREKYVALCNLAHTTALTIRTAAGLPPLAQGSAP